MTRLDLIQQQFAALWPIFAIAAVVILILGRRGRLHPRAIFAGPDRTIGLGPSDLLIGFGLMIVGSALLGRAVGAMVPVDADTGQFDQSLRSRLMIVVLSQLLMQVPPVAYLVIRAARAGGLRRTGLLPRRPLNDVRVGILAILAALPLVLSVMAMTTMFGILIGRPAPELTHDLLPAFQETGQPLAKFALIAAVVVIAPVVEEGMYRGLLQSTLVEMLGRRRRWWAVGIASALFAMIHLSAVTWHALPALLVLAVILGWLYERTGSLWPSILLHAGFNGCNVAMVMFVVSPP